MISTKCMQNAAKHSIPSSGIRGKRQTCPVSSTIPPPCRSSTSACTTVFLATQIACRSKSYSIHSVYLQDMYAWSVLIAALRTELFLLHARQAVFSLLPERSPSFQISPCCSGSAMSMPLLVSSLVASSLEVLRLSLPSSMLGHKLVRSVYGLDGLIVSLASAHRLCRQPVACRQKLADQSMRLAWHLQYVSDFSPVVCNKNLSYASPCDAMRPFCVCRGSQSRWRYVLYD